MSFHRAMGPWVRLLRAWWGKDRIRVSPTEGRLLDLDMGSLIEIEGAMFEITSRSVQSTRSGPVVTYGARSTSNGTTGDLSVRAGQRKVAWTVATETIDMDQTVIGCYGRPRDRYDGHSCPS